MANSQKLTALKKRNNMTTLVFIESAEGKIKKTSLEAVAYAHAMGGTVTAIALGTVDKADT